MVTSSTAQTQDEKQGSVVSLTILLTFLIKVTQRMSRKHHNKMLGSCSCKLVVGAIPSVELIQ